MNSSKLISWQRQQEIREAAENLHFKGTNQLILDLLDHIKYLDMALQSLTPGGSEYVNNPDRCVALVKEQKEALHKARCDLIRLERSL